MSLSLNEISNDPLSIKPIRYSKNTFEKKFFNTSHPALEKTKKNFLLKEEIRKLLISTIEISQLPKAILKLIALNSFESIHVLVHEKGTPIGFNYFYNYLNVEETRLIKIENFNNFFNLVKKSKNKVFNQTFDFKDDLDIVGNFIAQEMLLKNHEVIIIISRNSFLPPGPSEITSFHFLSLHLQFLISKILNKEKNELIKDIIKTSLIHFPEVIIIRNNEEILFSNKNESICSKKNKFLNFIISEDENTLMELFNSEIETTSTEIYHSQRLSLLGELLDTLRHELANPLFGIALTSSLLQAETENDEIKEIFNDITASSDRSQSIIKNFSNLYANNNQKTKINIYSFLKEVLALTKSETRGIKKSIEFVGPTINQSLEININAAYLTQIIFNLIINASQAIKADELKLKEGAIVIKLIQSNIKLTIEISDNGPGIKKEIFTKIFNPFFTTKESGTGLGLSICQNLAKQLKTKIHFKNNYPSTGATFWINLSLTN